MFPASQVPRAIAVLAVAMVAFLALPAARGWRVAAAIGGWSDFAAYFLPKSQYVAERYADGGLPLWNPWEFCGIPLLASLQVQAFYPPVVLFYSLWSGVTAQMALFFLHLALAALGTLLFMRSLGFGFWPSVMASLWVTQPLWLVRVYDQPNLLASISWTPWMFLLVRRCLLAPSLRRATGVAAVAALQFLAGYPPAMLASIYLVLLGMPFWIAEGKRRTGHVAALSKGALALIVAGCVSVLLVAAQLLPTAELASLTERQHDAARTHALIESGHTPPALFAAGTPATTIGAVVVDFWRTFGPALIAFAVLALLVHRRRYPVWSLFATVVLSGLLPYGAYVNLPLYSHMRWAFEWRRIAPMGVFMLAACGIDALLVRGWARPRAAAACALAIVVVSLEWNWRLIDPRWLQPTWLKPMAVPEWVRRCDTPAFRAHWPAGQPRAALFVARIRSIGGYEASLLPARTAQLIETLGIGNGIPHGRWAESVAANRTIAARMGLRCVPPAAAALQAYLIQESQPRVRLARWARFAGSAEEALQLLRGQPETVVLEVAPEPLPGDTCSGPPGTATVVSDQPEEIRITTDAPCPAYLVLADTNLPGWSATLDGSEVPILTADFVFRAVRVPAGRHEVVFRYAPWTVPAGIATSLMGLVVAVGIALLPRRYDPLARVPGGTARAPTSR
ncbi:MAG TPA: hypothetical protein VNO26_06625 [Candidatus Limnocylindria bacterium]|nr:hypothetical protein [Candidatus Limnocylindria bacterium]